MAPEHVLRNRPNKIAKGMTKTLYRHRSAVRPRLTCTLGPFITPSPETSALSVNGTLDKLGRGRWLLVEKIPLTCGCKCVHQKLRLSKAGRLRLKELKNRS